MLLLTVILLWSRFLGNVPIEFYGQVTDATGKGLPGALVKAEIFSEDLLQIPVPMANSSRTLKVVTATTDSQGKFHFSGRGTGVEITAIELPGWQPDTVGTPTGFLYPSGAHPPPTDPRKPVIYRMAPQR